MTTEEQLTAVFSAADHYQPSLDLFEKISRSIEEDTAHRRRVRRNAILGLAALGFVAVYLLLAVERVDGGFEMPFWSLEVLMTGAMGALVLILGPAIRRFGTAFERNIFRSSPGTGQSFLALMDVAFYLIFGAYTFMTLQYSPPIDDPGAQRLVEWVGWEIQRLAGLLLLMGLLHAVTMVALPVVGLVFSANLRRARRDRLGEAAPPADPVNELLDVWITVLVWILVGLGLVLLAFLVLPAIIGLGG